MEDRMDAASSTPEQPITRHSGRPGLGGPAGPGALGEPVVDEPGPAAVPVLQLTPVPPAARQPWAGAEQAAVAGAAVLVITAELGRRAGAPGRLTALYSAGACAAVLAPWLASYLMPEFASRLAARAVPRTAPPRAV